jgi:hypothetical protein
MTISNGMTLRRPGASGVARLRHPSGVLSLLATRTVFGTPTDITLAELSIEAFYPTDSCPWLEPEV